MASESESEVAEVWRLFRESREQFQQSREQIEALGRYLKETAERQDKRHAELETAFKAMGERQDKRHAELETAFKAMGERQDKRHAELETAFKAMGERQDKRHAELETAFREMGERQDKRHAETEAAIKAIEERMDSRHARTEAALDRGQRQLEDLKRLVADTNRQVGNLTGKWGRFVEEMVKPATETIFQPWGVPVHDRMCERKRERGGETMEFDIIVANDDAVVAIEVKSTLGADDVRDVLKKLPRFKAFFPEYRTYRVFGAVAGIVIADKADQFAAIEGLFVLRPSGETVAVINKDGFRPRTW